MAVEILFAVTSFTFLYHSLSSKLRIILQHKSECEAQGEILLVLPSERNQIDTCNNLNVTRDHAIMATKKMVRVNHTYTLTHLVRGLAELKCTANCHLCSITLISQYLKVQRNVSVPLHFPSFLIVLKLFADIASNSFLDFVIDLV